MAKKSSDMFEVTCPCCAAVLKVDAATEAVIAHTPPPTKKMFNDMGGKLPFMTQLLVSISHFVAGSVATQSISRIPGTFEVRKRAAR